MGRAAGNADIEEARTEKGCKTVRLDPSVRRNMIGIITDYDGLEGKVVVEVYEHDTAFPSLGQLRIPASRIDIASSHIKPGAELSVEIKANHSRKRATNFVRTAP